MIGLVAAAFAVSAHSPPIRAEEAPTPTPQALQGTAWVANEADNSITVIDAATNAVVTTLIGIEGPHNIQVAPDGASVWAVSGHEALAVMIDPATYRVHGTVPTGEEPAHIILTPDSATAYVTNSGDDTVTVIDATAMQVVATIPVGAYPHGLRPNPDGAPLLARLHAWGLSPVARQRLRLRRAGRRRVGGCIQY